MNQQLKITGKHIINKLPKKIQNIIYMPYNYFEYPDLREKKCSFGNNNENKTIYIIRPRVDGVEGLLALLLSIIRNLEYADRKGYIPVVDLKNYATQYNDNINVDNVWNYYFKDVSNITLEEAYSSTSVILSGLNAPVKMTKYIDQIYEEKYRIRANNIIKKYIRLNEKVIETIKMENVIPEKCVGLYLRGTDYVKMKPTGHPIQPTFEQAAPIVDELLEKYNLKYVFLVTEDEINYRKAKKYYGDKLKIASFDTFIKTYDGQELLGKSKNTLLQLGDSGYKRGLNYLCKIIILSQCKVFVAGRTCGSWMTYAFSNGFTEKYIFDLGEYS